ncbi:putative PsbP domain-containing protein 6, chloroplastic [Nannochloris sp. 'desiccata']|nr:putative PsbP domain-containing protein 6, chloroplastic [Chlorella desiccata (nom. nud.)]
MAAVVSDKCLIVKHAAQKFCSTRRSIRSNGRRLVVHASVSAGNGDRRSTMLALAAAAAGVFATPVPTAVAKTASRTAGDFLPKADADGYVLYTPAERATPALRAGVITASPNLYSFQLPTKWAEGTILNILSGNFCMPRCDEPWYEALWESPEEGSAMLVVSPLYRLVSKANATMKDLGPPQQVIEQIGPFITGNYLDSVDDDVLSMNTEEFADGRTYYTYEINAPYAKVGTHQLAAFTTKGDLAYLWVVAGNDKQWAKAESKLRYMLKTFKA